MRELQAIIITKLDVIPTINPEEEIRKRSRFLAEYLGKSGMDGLVLGISGGQDSLLAGILAKRAVEIRRNEGYDAQFHAVLLPYGQQTDRDDALLAIDVIQPDTVRDFDIAPATDAFAKSFASAEATPLADFDKGNVKARMRMIAQYALAGYYHSLVIGTDHAAEAITGFFTKFGDGGADITPLSGLNKRQGRQILTYLGVPELFTTKAPTADLLDGTPAQPDETELGLSYNTIDDYLEGKEINSLDAERLEARFTSTVHKRTTPVMYTRG